MIRVLIANDHALMRDGLRHILEKATGFHVVGEAADGSAALSLGRSTPAQVMLLDLSMPGRNGLEVVRQLKKENASVRTIMLTMHGEHQYAERAFKCGARGYLTKESAMTDLVAAITKVASGGLYLSPAMAERLACNLDRDPACCHTNSCPIVNSTSSDGLSVARRLRRSQTGCASATRR